MSAVWTLEHAAVEKTFADWGFSNAVRSLRSHGSDLFSFVDHADFDDAALFDYKDTVKVYKQTDPDDAGTKVKVFEGAAMPERRIASGDGEDLVYKIAGPWFWLEQRIFMQTWKSWNNSTEALEDVNKPRVNLGFTAAGTLQSSRAQLIEILDWSIAKGDPIQYDATDFPDVEIPIIPANQISCAQAIQIVLQATPDAVTWFDYTTSPPTFHAARRADLAAVTLAVDAGQARRIEIEPRPDLQVSAVVINYEITHSFNGVARIGNTVDKWPVSATGEESGAAQFAINLQGAQSTYQTNDLETQPIDADHATQATKEAWWKLKASWLNDTDLASFEIVSVTRFSALPNEPTSGSIQPWMKDGDGNAIQSEIDPIQAVIKFEYTDGRKGEKLETVRVRATDATTGKYTTLTSLISAEPVPSGLAKAYYDATSVLHYQGRFVYTREDVTGEASIGNLLRLSGGRAEWATMDAMIWSISEDIDRGETSVEIGPIEALSPVQFVANMELWRERFVWQTVLAQTTAQDGGLGMVDSTDEPPTENTSGGLELLRRLVMKPEDGQNPAVIDLNIDEAQGKEIRLRVVKICFEDDDGNKWTGDLIVPASAPFNLQAVT